MTNVSISSPTLQDVRDIYTHIFNGYDNRIRPLINQSEALSVSMTFLLSSINEFNEKSQKLVIAGWFIIRWVDESLTWNKSDFGNVSHVYVDGKSIWQPNIVLLNSFGRMNMLSQFATRAVINVNGEVEWFPSDSFVVKCEVDITYYPFDTQRCSLKFEMWDAPTSEVVLMATSKSIDTSYFEKNVEWRLTSSVVKNLEMEYGVPISSVQYFLLLQRRPKFVILTLIAPVILLAFLNICVFLIPLSSGEKNAFCVTVYLSYAVFLGIISSELPPNSKNVSYLAIYLLALLVFSVIIVLITVIQVRLFIEYGETPVPASILKVCGFCTNGTRSQVTPQDNNDLDVTTENVVEPFEFNNQNEKETITCLKDILPKFDIPLFFLFLVILCVMTSTIGAISYSHSI
ncbi:neuronal acetylcholine receptor subunit beta-3-like [Pecten maximus]|uniref:neuronal acetylcholine receptor subunit beta-3-like n=1 Tax=Pecten maximus TaxID=6579 RepID=UPI0014588121|nr:neuronal acetylcholine receptor subunit beta-3-like [Pecten maximus]